MWLKAFKVMMSLVLWAIIFACIAFAERLSRRHAATQPLTEISLSCSGDAERRLLSEQELRDIIEQSGAATIGTTLNKVDVKGVKAALEAQAMVKHAQVYLTHSGRLEVSVEQHIPLLRLRLNGYDSYLTSEGFVIPTPKGRTKLLPVVTGEYKPLFAASYEGYIGECAEQRIAELEERIIEIGKEFVKVVKEKRHYIEMRKRPRQRDGEKRAAYKQRLKEWTSLSDEMRRSRIRYYAGMERDAERRYQAIEQRQESLRAEIRELRKERDELMQFTRFVESLSRESFWSREVTQIVLNRDTRSGMNIELVPRSGDFRILFGSTEGAADKLKRLKRMYTKVLPTTGWDRYKEIDLKYKKQVICRQ